MKKPSKPSKTKTNPVKRSRIPGARVSVERRSEDAHLLTGIHPRRETGQGRLFGLEQFHTRPSADGLRSSREVADIHVDDDKYGGIIVGDAVDPFVYEEYDARPIDWDEPAMKRAEKALSQFIVFDTVLDVRLRQRPLTVSKGRFLEIENGINKAKDIIRSELTRFENAVYDDYPDNYDREQFEEWLRTDADVSNPGVYASAVFRRHVRDALEVLDGEEVGELLGRPQLWTLHGGMPGNAGAPYKDTREVYNQLTPEERAQGETGKVIERARKLFQEALSGVVGDFDEDAADLAEEVWLHKILSESRWEDEGADRIADATWVLTSEIDVYATIDENAARDALDAAVEWRGVEGREDEDEEDEDEEEDPEDGKLVYSFGGTNDFIGGASARGFYVKQIISKRSLKEESNALGHCIGQTTHGHPQQIREGQEIAFSIRAPGGDAKFTVALQRRMFPTEAELASNWMILLPSVEIPGSKDWYLPKGKGAYTLGQVKGKANRVPGFVPGSREFSKPDEVRLVVEFLTYLGFSREHIEKASDTAPGVAAFLETGVDPFQPPMTRKKKARDVPRANPGLPTSPRVRALLARVKPMGPAPRPHG